MTLQTDRCRFASRTRIGRCLAALAILLAPSLVLAGLACWKDNGAKSCCMPELVLCSGSCEPNEPPSHWGCQGTSDHTYTVPTVKKVLSGGRIELTTLLIGTCTKVNKACGACPGECIALMQFEVECVDTYPSDSFCP
ncbi:MAG: hypothetical protein JNM07_13655 [Phycisphaerae bacterium]|nr:hypothetical protein [Phycisphaerae bacterium]